MCRIPRTWEYCQVESLQLIRSVDCLTTIFAFQTSSNSSAARPSIICIRIPTSCSPALRASERIVVKGGLFFFDCGSKGLSQNALAELSGLSHSALSKIDNNKLSPTFEPILKIISGLNIDISDLLTSIQNKTPQRRKVFTRKGKGVNS